MKFATQLKKAMIDKGISHNNELAKQCGVSYYIVNRLMKNDGSCRLNDLSIVAEYLGVKIAFDNLGDGDE